VCRDVWWICRRGFIAEAERLKPYARRLNTPQALKLGNEMIIAFI
jgi:hypothetical protein